MRVSIINLRNQPLMPCKPSKAKKLLKEDKAKVISRCPFQIKLLYPTGEALQDMIGGMDTGSKNIGSSVITNGVVVYKSEIELRGEEIKKKMKQRSSYRRTRRGKKTRYRKPRFNNRSNSKKLNRLPPSMKHKTETHLKEKRTIEKLYPITKWKVETASFDIHKISDPSVTKTNGNGYTYQNGQLKNWYNVKTFILNRDSYKCQICKGKSKDLKLEVHHVVERSNGGGNSPDNLITLCIKCHKDLHSKKISLSKIKVSKTKHATEIGIIKSRLEKSNWDFQSTFGYETKYKREQILQLPKSHSNDAVAICCEDGEVVQDSNSVYFKKCISKGDYQQNKGIRSEKPIKTGKIHGFRKFDKVKYERKDYFIKGRMSTGYAILMDIDGKKIELKPIPKLSKLIRKNGRKSWIISQKTIKNT